MGRRFMAWTACHPLNSGKRGADRPERQPLEASAF